MGRQRSRFSCEVENGVVILFFFLIFEIGVFMLDGARRWGLCWTRGMSCNLVLDLRDLGSLE